jgi:hypothetical protein
VAIAFHLHQLTTNLLQGAKLCLKADVIGLASLHLLSQVSIQLIVLSCGLTSSLSSSGLLLGSKAKLSL